MIARIARGVPLYVEANSPFQFSNISPEAASTFSVLSFIGYL